MKANVFGASFPIRWGVSTSPRISDGISTRMETRIPSAALHHPSAFRLVAEAGGSDALATAHVWVLSDGRMRFSYTRSGS